MLRKKLFSEENQSSSSEDKPPGLLDLSLQNCASADISKYFPNITKELPSFTALQFLQIQKNLNEKLEQLNFSSPICYVYNPTIYAYNPNECYVKKYCKTPKKLLLIGMNPGPFGMCQSGVPFGDVNMVKHFLKVEGLVSKPPVECLQRRVLGFDCPRKEQSGDRFWRFFRDLCGTAERFFENAFLCNYCPLAFLDASGKNLTPVDFKDRQKKEALESICDQHYIEIITLLQPETIIAIGDYIEKRTKSIIKSNLSLNHITLVRMPHPSPRAVNNQNWPEKANNFLVQHNLKQFFQQKVLT